MQADVVVPLASLIVLVLSFLAFPLVFLSCFWLLGLGAVVCCTLVVLASFASIGLGVVLGNTSTHGWDASQRTHNGRLYYAEVDST
jgi:hypothetical protein